MFNWFRKRSKANKLLAQLEADRYTRQQLMDTLRKNMEGNDKIVVLAPSKLHASPNRIVPPTVSRRVIHPATVSKDFYETLERLGAPEEFLNDLKPIVKD